MLRKKSLGQHFLTSAHYLSLIADSAELKEGDEVLEIGPGEGTLTAELLSRSVIVTAIEKDHRLLPVLQTKFAEEIKEGKLKLVEGDALKLDTTNHLPASYKLVANIPYYITGAIIEKFLSAHHQPTTMVLLVQKEVAERIARSKKESILSLSVKVYGDPHYIKTVPAGAFSPPPEVDSAILSVMNISRKNFMNERHEERFFALLHAGFAHKRKLLVRNLEILLGKESFGILPPVGDMQKTKIPENARAEDVSLDKWLSLAAY
jgi:16S rRNA (adenine1518-N6/adenine1519-N6)-dimethyltransferase